MPTAYQLRVLDHLATVLGPVAPFVRALDFGSGDGWIGSQLLDLGLVGDLVGVDVHRRDHAVLEPIIYDGEHLPFDDRSFDLVYAVDVFHHMADPRLGIAEALRCSSAHFVLKDHTYENWITKCLLGVFDNLGNRRFGVPSRYKYQQGWEWLPLIASEGFVQDTLTHPLRCEERPVLRQLLNEPQFIGRWHRA